VWCERAAPLVQPAAEALVADGGPRSQTAVQPILALIDAGCQ
jgi:hypothetical protein